jgi:hypothetical protein
MMSPWTPVSTLGTKSTAAAKVSGILMMPASILLMVPGIDRAVSSCHRDSGTWPLIAFVSGSVLFWLGLALFRRDP